MQRSQPPEDDGLIVMKRMAPDQFDVVLGSHPAKRPAPHKRSALSFSTLVIVLALICACAFTFTRINRTHSAPAPAAVVSAPAQVPEVMAPEASGTVAEPIRTEPQVVYVAPKAEPASAPAKQLDDCLKQGNVIDQDVINCRFGQSPRGDAASGRAQGMVSDRYMADYKSAASKTNTEQRGKQYQVAGVFIRGVNDRNRYEARYRIFNNHIENSSVCMNFLSDSVEHGECRKAAAPYFKDMCSDWSKRLAKEHDEKTRLAQEQFCEASGSYQP